MNGAARRGAYIVPSYRAPDDTPWYHFLHGNVPGHQIDFIYRPEIPQGRLSQQHFSHLSRLMKYIEPQTNGRYAFAIGNLSRDDTQYEPGHGGVALIFGLRIRGVTDHAGRADPPFAHAAAAIDRELDYATLLASSMSFHQHVVGAMESAEWYRTYVGCATESPERVLRVLAGYVERFSDLPCAPASTMSSKWVTGSAPQPARIVISHDHDAPFELIARCAARIAAMLYRSDIRWTSISNGREADLPNGVSIRLVAERDLTPADMALGVRSIHEVPEDEAEIALQLFGAMPVGTEAKPALKLGWRERFSASAPMNAGEPRQLDAGPPQSSEVESDRAITEIQRPSCDAPVPCSAGASASEPPPPPSADEVTLVWHGPPENTTPLDDNDKIDVQWDEPGIETPPPPTDGSVVPAPSPAPLPLNPAALPAPANPMPVPPTSQPVSKVALEWEPSAGFRRRQTPMWRWPLVGMALAAGVLLVLYRVFDDDTSPSAGETNGSKAPAAIAEPASALPATASAPPMAAAPTSLPSADQLSPPAAAAPTRPGKGKATKKPGYPPGKPRPPPPQHSGSFGPGVVWK